MSDFTPGKVSTRFAKQVLANNIGYVSNDILPGNINGFSSGIVNIGGKAVSVTTRPFFLVPDYGIENATWFAMQILFSAAITSGLPIKYLSLNLSLPMDCNDEAVELIWKAIHNICNDYGVTIISNRINRTRSASFPWIGSATIISEGELDNYVSPMFASADDDIILTKGPAVSSAALLSVMFPNTIAKEYGEDFTRNAMSLFETVSSVNDAKIALSCGIREQGVNAIWDASDRGVLGSLVEFAERLDLGFAVYHDKVQLDPYVDKICKLFNIDPLTSFSTGSLLLTCHSTNTDKILAALNDNEINACCIGKITGKNAGMVSVKMGLEIPVRKPDTDTFWNVFFDAYNRGLN